MTYWLDLFIICWFPTFLIFVFLNIPQTPLTVSAIIILFLHRCLIAEQWQRIFTPQNLQMNPNDLLSKQDILS